MGDQNIARRVVAGILATLGAAIPLFMAAFSPAVTSREVAGWNGLGLLCFLVAFVVWEWSDRTGVRRRLASWEQVIQQMRGAILSFEQMQRQVADIEQKLGEVGLIKQSLNEQRHNLSLVASGMVEIRESIDTERANLGALSAGVHEVRVASEQRDRDVGRFSVEVHNFNEIVIALRTHFDSLSSNLSLIEERIVAEQRNLGLVAAGLDAVRRSASGIDRFSSRQAAFEDALVLIADRVDTLNASVSTQELVA